MDNIVQDIFAEICVQMKKKDVKDSIYETIVHPLVLYTAYQLKIPLVIIILLLILLIILLASIWWNTSKNKGLNKNILIPTEI